MTKIECLQSIITGDLMKKKPIPSKAVVYVNEGMGFSILSTAGPHVTSFAEEEGTSLSEVELESNDGTAPKEPGIYVWEGRTHSVHYNTPDCNEWDCYLMGTYRKATQEELQLVMVGKCPWDHNDWPEPSEDVAAGSNE